MPTRKIKLRAEFKMPVSCASVKLTLDYNFVYTMFLLRLARVRVKVPDYSVSLIYSILSPPA